MTLRFWQASENSTRPVGGARRLALGAVFASMLALAGCGGDTFPGLGGGSAPPGGGGQASGQTIGTGPVKVALILPFSNANSPAQSLRNAAELALSEFQGNEITILLKDDGGSAGGAQAAARAALAEGAELIIGPLFSPTVAAAGPIAKAAGKPMIAFSSDQAVAQEGVYLLSFLPQSSINRVVDFAASKGKRNFAILAPQTPYGNITTQLFKAAVARVPGGRIVSEQAYAPGTLATAAAGLAGSMGEADSVFVPDEPQAVAAAASALGALGKQLIGTDQWKTPAVYGAAGLSGSWFAAPADAGFASFSERYQAKFGSAPARVATLAYDAVALANVLTRTQGENRFAPAVLTTASGFGGQDGVFRFRADGLNERALAVFQVGEGAASVVSAAPRSFARRSGT